MKRILLNSVWVGLGGMAGSLARYYVSLGLQRLAIGFPLGTLTVNLAGCFAIGALAQLAGPAGGLSPEVRLLLATGFCGGFTTMSSFVYEGAQFLRDREALYAAEYVVLTLAGSFLAFYLGSLLTRLLLRVTGGIWN